MTMAATAPSPALAVSGVGLTYRTSSGPVEALRGGARLGARGERGAQRHEGERTAQEM